MNWILLVIISLLALVIVLRWLVIRAARDWFLIQELGNRLLDDAKRGKGDDYWLGR